MGVGGTIQWDLLFPMQWHPTGTGVEKQKLPVPVGPTVPDAMGPDRHGGTIQWDALFPWGPTGTGVKKQKRPVPIIASACCGGGQSPFIFWVKGRGTVLSSPRFDR